MAESPWELLRSSVGLTVRPIEGWPGEVTYDREKGPFKSAIKTTIKDLRREMVALNAQNIVLQVAVRERDLRLDGLPRANITLQEPGVILSFEARKHGALTIYFDGFLFWENNLRAISEHLNHLRMASAYGVGRNGEQYRGWAALPPPPKPDEPPSNDFWPVPENIPEPAWKAAIFLARQAFQTSPDKAVERKHLIAICCDSVYFQLTYRTAVVICHPDGGGEEETMKRVNEAAAILKARHGL